MNRIFRPNVGKLVPDGTRVSPFLNPTDSTAELPVDLFGDVSLALGEIEPRQASKIHVHPIVTMIVWVIQGSLELKLKDQEAEAPYTLALRPEEAAVVLPGTFVQLINVQEDTCRVLYIMSPPYVSVYSDTGSILYQDAIVLENDWNTLADQDWHASLLAERAAVVAARHQAIQQLHGRKDSTQS